MTKFDRIKLTQENIAGYNDAIDSLAFKQMLAAAFEHRAAEIAAGYERAYNQRFKTETQLQQEEEYLNQARQAREDALERGWDE